MEWMEVVDVINRKTENFENCIYLWRNKTNEKLYVGQAKDFRERTKKHKRASFNENQKCDYNVPLHSAIRKYGIDNFEVCILEFDLNDFEKMNEKEIFYIKKFDTLTNNKKGYNVSSGGGNGNNFAGKTDEEMDEIRKKQSKAHSGENNHMYGKQHSDEAKQRISETHKGENNHMYGKHHSDEAKMKMSENHADISGKNNPRARKIILLNTMETFNYVKQAGEKYGVNSSSISANCRGIQKSAGKDENGNKLVWMYYEDYMKLTQEEIDEIKNF